MSHYAHAHFPGFEHACCVGLVPRGWATPISCFVLRLWFRVSKVALWVIIAIIIAKEESVFLFVCIAERKPPF